MFQSPGAIAIQVGPVAIHWYGVIIAAGILLCYFYIASELKRRGLPREPVENMAFWLVASGIIGARLYYVIFQWPYYAENPGDIFQIWKGGLAIHGALIGGALAYFVYTWRHKLNWRLYADVLIPGVLFAQALGRWGNFFNNEAFGTPTNFPWKIFIPEENRPEGFADFSYFHPTFLYESIWNLAGFFFLVFLTRKWKNRPHGAILAAYLMYYSFGRFLIEGIRTDSLYIGQLRAAQLMSVLLFCIGFFLLIFWRKKHKIN